MKANPALLWKLRGLMFFQFSIWGTWYMTIGAYMAKMEMADGIAWTYTVGPIAALISPFTVGMMADRLFQTQRMLSILFLLSAVFIGISPIVAGPGQASTFNTFIFLHMLCFMPTLGLTASLCMTHLKEAANDFPIVRVWGTLGWIFAASSISLPFLGESEPYQLYLAAVYSTLLAVAAWFLPATPAPKKGEPIKIQDLLFLDAWKLLTKLNFLIFMVSAFLICIPLAAFYVYLQPQMMAMGVESVGFYKSFGQWSEVIFMLLMPFFFRRLGVKKMLIIGMGAWALRYFLFYIGAQQNLFALIMVGVILHGICYDFFFVVGHIFVDQAAPKKIRAQAQSLFIFFTQGLGLALGAKISEQLFKGTLGDWDKAVDASSLMLEWPNFWIALAIMAAIVTITFALTFHHNEEK